MGLTTTPSPDSPATRRSKIRQPDLDFSGASFPGSIANVPKVVPTLGQTDSTERYAQAPPPHTSSSEDSNGDATAETTFSRDVIRTVHGHTTKINREKQEKHIPGSHYYIPGKGILTISLREAQELVNQFAGTGQFVDPGHTKERVDFGKPIGIHVVLQTQEQVTTTIGIIHYSKNGTHLVPAKPHSGD